VFVCLFAYSSRTDKPGQNSGKSVQSSIPGEYGSCSSEIKHNRKTAPRQKLFISKRRLRKQISEPPKTVLGSIPGEDVLCSSETKHDRTAKRIKLFVLARRLSN
jgi:hypothetical protein